MQMEYMNRVLGIFIDLQPVTRGRQGKGDLFHTREMLCIVFGEIRSLVRWAHVGEQDAVFFRDRIGTLDHFSADRVVQTLGTGSDQRAVNVVVLTVIAANDAAFRNNAVLQ